MKKKGIVTLLGIISAVFVVANTAYGMERNSVVAEINEVRIENGISPLEVSETLANCAEIRAQEAGEKWSHTRPNGNPWYTVDDKSYGENLAKGFADDTEMLTAWLQSPTHRENILNPGFKSIYVSDNGNGFVACEFGV